MAEDGKRMPGDRLADQAAIARLFAVAHADAGLEPQAIRVHQADAGRRDMKGACRQPHQCITDSRRAAVKYFTCVQGGQPLRFVDQGRGGQWRGFDRGYCFV